MEYLIIYLIRGIRGSLDKKNDNNLQLRATNLSSSEYVVPYLIVEAPQWNNWMKMPTGSQVRGCPAAGFDQSGLKAPLKISEWFSVSWRSSHCFHSGWCKAPKKKKRQYITKLPKQTLMSFLAVLHSLAHPRHHVQVSRTLITSESTGMLLRCPASALDRSIFSLGKIKG